MNKDEAIQVIRSNYPTGKNQLCEALETLIPELKESEDERIRKEIIAFVEQNIHHGGGTPIYLTKNGSTYSLIPEEQETKWIAWLEKQCEQKSTDNLRWNELTWEDVNTIEEIINEVHSDFRNGIGVESFGKCVLERFRGIKGNEYMDTCEQKPAWSEEDEIRAAQIISDLEKCTVPGFPVYIGGVELEINWLKSLKERMKGE